MTLKNLNQLYWLYGEIDMNIHTLKSLELEPEAADIRTIVEARQIRCIQERDALEAYIAAIDDNFTRQVFTLRYVEGLTWKAVAARMGGQNSPSNMRMLVHRYIAKTA